MRRVQARLPLIFSIALGAALGAGGGNGWAAEPVAAGPVAAEPVAAEPVRQAPRIVLRSVQFALDSATVDAGSLATLELAARWMQENPGARLRIEGHSSAPGGEAYNLELSRQRALGVKRVLTDYGVSPDRLEAVGRGESSSIASNDTPEGQALNRRVEFVVVEGSEAVKTVDDVEEPAAR